MLQPHPPLLHLLLALSVIASALAACEDAAPPFTRCVDDQDCGVGERCIQGLCGEPVLGDTSALDGAADVPGDATAVDTTPSPDTSGAICVPACSVGETCCGGRCVDLQTTATHCGGCGESCFALPESVAVSCVGGACSIDACAAGRDDCDGDPDNGCETDVTVPGDCGGCGVSCGVGEVCDAGTCVCGETTGAAAPACGAGTTCCGGACVETGADACACGDCGSDTCCNGLCADTTADVDNCGGCGQSCGPSTRCEGGQCRCLSGALGDDDNCGGCGRSCGPAQRCESGVCVCGSGVLGDDANCGGCGLACGPSQRCDGTQCVCESGVLNDDANCGGCGQACAGGTTCSRDSTGTWACDGSCPTGETLCDGACVDTDTDMAHCGGCGQTCRARSGAVNAGCSAGVCAQICQADRADCDGDPSNGCEVSLDDNNSCGLGCGTVVDCGGIGDECRGSTGRRYCRCDWQVRCNPGETCEPRLGTDNCVCGDTGSACANGSLCCATSGGRACVNPLIDANNCGGCGVVCGSGSCVLGVCS